MKPFPSREWRKPCAHARHRFDEQYRDPAAVATEWDETRKVLETAEIFWLSTVRSAGQRAPPPAGPIAVAIAAEIDKVA